MRFVVWVSVAWTALSAASFAFLGAWGFVMWIGDMIHDDDDDPVAEAEWIAYEAAHYED